MFLASDMPITSGCSTRPGPVQQRVQEYRNQDDRHAQVEQRGELALFAQQHDGQDDLR
jgi:hypothetical protein